MILQLFLKPRLVKRCLPILHRLDLRLPKIESSPNSSLQSGMVARISLAYLPDRNPQMCELYQTVVMRMAMFKFFEGLPGPGIAVSYRGVTDPAGVGNVYEVDEAAGDRV